MTAATVENSKQSKGPEAQASAPSPVYEPATDQIADIRGEPQGPFGKIARFFQDSFGNLPMAFDLMRANMRANTVIDRWFDPYSDATKSDLTQALIPADNLKRIGIEMINDKMGTTVPEFLRAVNAGMGGRFRTDREKMEAICLVLGGMMWDKHSTVFSRNPIEQASMVKMLSAVSTPYEGIFQVQRVQVFDKSPTTRAPEVPPSAKKKKGQGGASHGDEPSSGKQRGSGDRDGQEKGSRSNGRGRTLPGRSRRAN